MLQPAGDYSRPNMGNQRPEPTRAHQRMLIHDKTYDSETSG